MALNGTVCTDRREIAADDFFTGLFTTALEPDEIVCGVRFPRVPQAHYLKFEQPASRFALTGVAVARLDQGVRVAVTGLGSGIWRWQAAEQALVHRLPSHRKRLKAWRSIRNSPQATSMPPLNTALTWRPCSRGARCSIFLIRRPQSAAPQPVTP
jgi:CO/xanthine dehydrogenase FAD-binding subunit